MSDRKVLQLALDLLLDVDSDLRHGELTHSLSSRITDVIGRLGNAINPVQPTMPDPGSVVERYEDMSPDGRLRIIQGEDGDMILAIIPPSSNPITASPSVEFCSVGMGGGGSPRTLRALRQLFHAMHEDNHDPDWKHRAGDDFAPR